MIKLFGEKQKIRTDGADASAEQAVSISSDYVPAASAGSRQYMLPAIICFIGIVINVGGRTAVYSSGLPLYFDTAGTILAAFLGGYVPGIATALLTNILNYLTDSVSIYYGAINVLLALVTTFAAHNGKLRSARGVALYVIVMAAISAGIGGIITWVLQGMGMNENETIMAFLMKYAHADNFAKYGNISYYISDDGTTTNQVQVYAGDGLNGEKFKAVTDIKAGDEVVVFGHLYKYVNNNTGAVTPEISESYLISLKSGSGGDPTPSGEGKGSGTAADPYNPIAAINYAKSLGADVESSNEVYVKGKISSIKFTYSAQYGTATYNISEDGSTANEFTVYGSYYFNNQSWKEGDTQIKVGDEVVVCGKVVYYQGNTPEFANKKNWLVSLNSGSGGGGGDSGGGGETTGNVTKEVSGTTLTLTVNDATADNSVTVDLGAQGWSNAQEVTSLTLSDGTVITFAVSSEGGTTPKYYDGTKGVRLYAKNILTITGKDKGIAKVVLNCDSYQGTNYVGNTTLTANASGKSLTIVNEHTGTSGGVQLRVKTMEITYAK